MGVACFVVEVRAYYCVVHWDSSPAGSLVCITTVPQFESGIGQTPTAGASGYVLKGAASADLVAAVRAVHEGGVYLHPSVAKNLVSAYLKHMDPGEDKERYDGLSERERQVLTLIAEGKTSQEVADELFLSVNTIQTHRSHIMEKLNLHNRAELIRYAIRKGLITK